jgi:hypothetical protein
MKSSRVQELEQFEAREQERRDQDQQEMKRFKKEVAKEIK